MSSNISDDPCEHGPIHISYRRLPRYLLVPGFVLGKQQVQVVDALAFISSFVSSTFTEISLSLSPCILVTSVSQPLISPPLSCSCIDSCFHFYSSTTLHIPLGLVRSYLILRLAFAKQSQPSLIWLRKRIIRVNTIIFITDHTADIDLWQLYILFKCIKPSSVSLPCERNVCSGSSPSNVQLSQFQEEINYDIDVSELARSRYCMLAKS